MLTTDTRRDTLSFQTLSSGQNLMRDSWEYDDGRSGVTFFVLYREQPSELEHVSERTMKAANGREFHIGLILVCGHPCCVAWPV